jgi:hypothetical protein
MLALDAGSRVFIVKEDVDVRDIAERSNAVLRTAMRGHDEENIVLMRAPADRGS